MTRLALLLLILLALVGLGTLVSRTGFDGSEGLTPDWPGPALDGSEESRSPLSDGGAATLDGLDPFDSVSTLEPSTGSSTGSSTGVRMSARSQTLVRVTHTDGSAFPGVRLLFFDRSQAKGWQAQWSDSRNRSLIIRNRGQGFESDAAGELLIPRASSGVLTTRNPTQHADHEWSGRLPKTLTLVVSTVSDLRLKIVDSKGRPQSAVAVVLERVADGSYLPVLNGTSTSPAGEVYFPNLRRSLKDPAPGVRFAASFGFPAEDSPHVVFDPLNLPEEPLVLTLPPAGSLHVQVYNEQGVLMDEVVNVNLGRLDISGEFQGLMHRRLIGGEAVFGHVGLGAGLAVRLDGSRDRPALVEEITGPNTEGAEKTVVLRWTQRHPVLIGRAVSAGGEILAVQRGRFALDQGQGPRGGPPLTTDEEGRFRIVVTPPMQRLDTGSLTGVPDRGQPFQLVATLSTSVGLAPLEASHSFRLPDSAGEYDMGDLLFEERPLLVSGRVTDIAGAALIGVQVRIEEQLPGKQTWRPVREQSVITDHLGRYTIYGSTSGQPLRLVALRRGFATSIRESFSHGAAALDIILSSEPAPGSEDARNRRPKRGKPGLVPNRDGRD